MKNYFVLEKEFSEVQCSSCFGKGVIKMMGPNNSIIEQNCSDCNGLGKMIMLVSSKEVPLLEALEEIRNSMNYGEENE